MVEDQSSVPTGVGAPPLEKEELDKPETRIYEVGYLLFPTIAAEEVPREVTAVTDLLEHAGAVVFAEEFPKLRQLAYRIKKQSAGGYQTFTSAYFGWIKFESEAAAAKRVEAALAHMTRVLRFLMIKTVRENTMSVPRPPRPEFRREHKEAPKGAPAPTPVSEAELEKAMEKIIGEN